MNLVVSDFVRFRGDTQARFPLGEVFATEAALACLTAPKKSLRHFVIRHATADWVEMSEDAQQRNSEALAHGFAVISTYALHDGTLCLFTDADRRRTLVLLEREVPDYFASTPCVSLRTLSTKLPRVAASPFFQLDAGPILPLSTSVQKVVIHG